MAEPERALFPEHLPEAPPDSFSRLYFGAEFCYGRLPDAETILAARRWARDVGWHFTLVTPVLAESERQNLAARLQIVLPACEPGDEVVISDWGGLDLVRMIREDLVVVAGRVLSEQKRGPRILDMNLTAEQKRYFQRSAWHNREAVALLHELAIERVELDNLLQGLAPLPGGLKGSLHVPFAMVSSSRNCPFRRPAQSGPCDAPCGEWMTLRSSETGVILYQHGNTQFLRHPRFAGPPAELGIDRVVVTPDPVAMPT